MVALNMIKQMAIAQLFMLLSSCSPESEHRKLEDCWNVNTQNAGIVEGNGLFIVLAHGLSLQSPGCSDALGRNSFELSKNDEDEINLFIDSFRNRPRYLTFQLTGEIYNLRGTNLLKITQIKNLKNAAEPGWISQLHRRDRITELR